MKSPYEVTIVDKYKKRIRVYAESEEEARRMAMRHLVVVGVVEDGVRAQFVESCRQEFPDEKV